MRLRSPYPYYGGKATVSSEVWARFGNVDNYIEPFFGSGAILLGRPHGNPRIETVNDIDGFISNFWRAVKADAKKVAEYADWPQNDNDLHARHIWLISQRDDITRKLEGDPEFYDVKAAGWWVWGICLWIGGGWCRGDGSWTSINGEMVKSEDKDVDGVFRKRITLVRSVGIFSTTKDIYEWFSVLQRRLKSVKICCGDWLKVVSCESTTTGMGETGVFLDPPYSKESGRDMTIYTKDDGNVAHDTREWSIENGEKMRIALCGFDGEHKMPDDWEEFKWMTSGGFSNISKDEESTGKVNLGRERIWFSPRCLKTGTKDLFV